MCRHVTTVLHPGLYRLCYVSLTTGNVLDMYKSIAWELGLPTERSRATAYRAIRTEVTRLVCETKQLPVLVIDEAHHLRNDVLEDLRLLCNYEMDSENRLCVLFVGLTELRRRLAMAVHESLSQRLVVRHHLTGLDRDELDHYLTHRLRDPPVRTPRHRGAVPERARSATTHQPHRPLRPDRRRRQRRPYRQRRAPRARCRGAAAMNLPNLPYLLVPYELSDEAAAHVSELLNDLAVAFDGQYFAQIRRYYDERRDIERFCQDGQLDLFDYDDVEF